MMSFWKNLTIKIELTKKIFITALLASFLLLSIDDGNLVQAKSIGKYKKILKNGYLIKDFPYEKQKNRYYCGPAVLKMILQYYGIVESQDEIAKEVYDPSSKVTYNSELLYYVNKKGLKGYSFEGNLNLLKHIISKNIPIIVLQKPIELIYKAHYRIVIGYDAEKKYIIFQDPLLGSNYYATEEYFDKVWQLGPGLNKKKWSMIVVDNLPVNASEEYSNSAITDINIATALYKRKEYDESLKYWISASEKLPNHPHPFYGAALVYLRKEEIKLALDWAIKSVTIEPKDIFALDTLAMVYIKLNEKEKAIEALEKAYSINSKDKLIKKHLQEAKALFENNKKEVK